MKWPKIRLRRVDVERVLIACSAALVLMLSVRGRNMETEPYEEPLEQIPVSETAASASAKALQQTVVYYEDGDGYLVPVQRDVERQDGIAKATLGLMVQSPRNDMDAADVLDALAQTKDALDTVRRATGPLASNVRSVAESRILFL